MHETKKESSYKLAFYSIVVLTVIIILSYFLNEF